MNEFERVRCIPIARLGGAAALSATVINAGWNCRKS